MRWSWADSMAQGYLPDALWWCYRWTTNHRRMRQRYPNPVRAIGYQRRLSAEMRKPWQ